MPLDTSSQNSFSQGELGPYMEGRDDIAVYQRGLMLAENWLLLPQGGMTRRTGFEYVAHINTDDATLVSLRRFDFGLSQQYVLVFTDKTLTIYKDKLLAATIATPYSLSEVRGIRTAQSGDSLVIVYEGHAPRVLERLGSDTNWAIQEIEFDKISFYRFNIEQSLTPSANTGNITLTLSPADAYWKAGHVGVHIRVNPDTANLAYAEITGFQQNATGGTAYSSAGTPANAFDSNLATICSAGATGWIGYGWGAAKTVRVVAINPDTTSTVNLVLETDNNSGFTSPTAIITYNGLQLTAGEWTYINIPEHTGETHARVRATSGTLNVKTLVFNEGVVATATVGTTNLAGTGADEAWAEEAWSEAQGYPRSVCFHQNRLVFGGTYQAPDTVFASKVGDFYNFDDAKTDDDYAFKFTISSDTQQRIMDIKSKSRTMKIFSSGGEFNMTSGDTSALSPTSVQIDNESGYGVNDVPVLELDSTLIYITANNKEVRSFEFDVSKENYASYNFTRIAHHLFDRGRFPRAAASLRSWKDTQANYLFVPREDGEMAVFSYVSSTAPNEGDIFGWSRWSTDGWFCDAVVVSTDHGDGVKIDTLYCVVERDNGVFLEALTEDKVFVDHWYIGSDTPAKTTWTNMGTLAGKELQVVADGFVQPNVTVAGVINSASVDQGGTGYTLGDILTVVGGDGTAATLEVTGETGGVITSVSVETEGDYDVIPPNPVTVTGGTGSNARIDLNGGRIEIAEPAENIVVGLGYESRAQTLDLTITASGKTRRGDQIILKRAFVRLHETLALAVQGRPLSFRNFDSGNFGDPLEEFTGTATKSISGRGTNVNVTLSVTDPLQCTVLGLSTEYKVGL